MTYQTYEISTDNGQPAQLFEFTYSGQGWYYTTADAFITNNGKTYSPAAIQCAAIPGVTDPNNSNVTITMPRDSAIAELFRVVPPSEQVFVTIYGEHIDDVNSQFAVIWKGRITNCEWQGPIISLNSDSVFTSLLRSGLGPRFSRQCTATIYDSKCSLSRESWKIAGPASAVTGTTITVPAAVGKPDNYFAGGYISWVNNATGNTEVRFIRSSYNASGSLTLSSQPMGLTLGGVVSVYPGCDHQLLTCDTKFHNAANYRGMPYIPPKSPFGGTALY